MMALIQFFQILRVGKIFGCVFTLIAFLHSLDLEQTLRKVSQAGGTVIKPIFAFPGGRRFHFREPSGNEFAVWSEPLE